MDIQLTNYRCYTSHKVSSIQDKTVFIGTNGVGKTSILEAFYILQMGKSWRDNSALIQDKHDISYIRMLDNDDNSYSLELTKTHKTLYTNDKKTSWIHHIGTKPVLLFAPEVLAVLSKSRIDRLQWFDKALVQLYPSYKTTLLKAQKTIEQKKMLLKRDMKPSYKELDIWNIMLSKTLPEVYKYRKTLLNDIADDVKYAINTLSNKAIDIHVQCKSDVVDNENDVYNTLKNNYYNELQSCKSALSYDKDDMQVLWNDVLYGSICSRGEERTVLLALLYALKKRFLKDNKTPYMLLDDVASELDIVHQNALNSLFDDAYVYITTTQKIPNTDNYEYRKV